MKNTYRFQAIVSTQWKYFKLYSLLPAPVNGLHKSISNYLTIPEFGQVLVQPITVKYNPSLPLLINCILYML